MGRAVNRLEELDRRCDALRARAILQAGDPTNRRDRLQPLDDVLPVELLRAFLTADDDQPGGRMARGYRQVTGKVLP